VTLGFGHFIPPHIISKLPLKILEAKMSRLNMSEIKEVLRLRFQNELSLRKITLSTGIPKSTVSDYINRFNIAGLELTDLLNMPEEAVYDKFFPERSMPQVRKRPLPDMDYIAGEIRKKGVTWLLLWQEYKQIYPDGYNYTQFRKYCKAHIKRLNPTMRQIYHAGETMFVDYSGLTMEMVDAVTGEVSDIQVFTAALGASGAVFVHATPNQTKECFIMSHTLAFRYFGGVPKTLIPDNLKSAVTKHTRNVLTINDSYADMARYYGCAVLPARPKKPTDKSKVEQAVQGIQRWIMAKLRHRTFFSVQEINDAMEPLLEDYNNKIMRGMGKSRHQMLAEIDLPAMLPLPSRDYRYREYVQRTVDTDYHVQVDKAFYSAPYTLSKTKVDVWYSANSVEIYHQGRLVASHPRLIRGASTLDEHMPPQHIAMKERWNEPKILNWAASIGFNTARLMKEIMNSRNHPVNAFRTCRAILSMAKDYSKEEFDMACSKACGIRAYTVKSIQSILKHKLYIIQPDKNKEPLMNHGNIRGRDYYKEEDNENVGTEQSTGGPES
jgi:transposase